MSATVRVLLLLATGVFVVAPAPTRAGGVWDQAFSADSRMFAGVYHQFHYGIQFNLGGPQWKSWTVLALYQGVADSARPRRVKIATGESVPPLYQKVQLRLSPDGEWIALSFEGELWLIEARTGRKTLRSSADRRISSFAWRGPTELIYAAPTKDDTRCTLYVIDVRAEQAPRLVSEIQRSRGKFNTVIGCGDEVWSPNGRFLIYNDSVLQNLRMLDTRTGTNTFIAPQKVSVTGELIRQVAWKLDEREVVIALENARRPWFFHYDVVTAVTTDLSRRFAPVATDYHAMEPIWTADGYILFSAPDVTLVRPIPWEARIIPISDDPHLVKRKEPRVLPFPGIFSTFSDIRKYDGSIVGELDGRDGSPRVSPDGKWVGRITYTDGKIIITPFPAKLLTR